MGCCTTFCQDVSQRCLISCGRKGKLSSKNTRLTFNLLPALLSVANLLSSERENSSILGSVKKGTKS